jgi:V8-like Glu-specific endopeptidase
VAACLALSATACSGDDGPSDNQAESTPTPTAPTMPENPDLQDLVDQLPFEFDLEAWLNGGWQDWDRETWAREIDQFVNPIIEGLWDLERMIDAQDPEQAIDDALIDEDSNAPESDDPMDDRGVTDPVPDPVDAREVATPYTLNAPPVGKVFFDTPEGQMVCSGTVVSDPNAPGESNLVATAGHCVHAGATGGWYRNVMFVPAFNENGFPPDELQNAPLEQIAPHGLWWADYVSTTEYWLTQGSDAGGDGAHGDFAVMSVQPQDGGGASLEETVGGAVDVDFDAPAVAGLGEVTLYGYPEARPYDGTLMYECTDSPARLAIDPEMPVLYRAGCTMTGGASGGPWLRPGDGGGAAELVSVNSIGPLDSTWLAGPRLDVEAQGVLEAVSAHDN